MPQKCSLNNSNSAYFIFFSFINSNPKPTQIQSSTHFASKTFFYNSQSWHSKNQENFYLTKTTNHNFFLKTSKPTKIQSPQNQNSKEHFYIVLVSEKLLYAWVLFLMRRTSPHSQFLPSGTLKLSWAIRKIPESFHNYLIHRKKPHVSFT